jgi:HSP20 family molecular chaperone IbpA
MDAKYENGVLFINIAKKAAGQSGAARRIQVQ